MPFLPPPPDLPPRAVVLSSEDVAAIAGATENRQWRRDLHDSQVFVSGAMLGAFLGVLAWKNVKLFGGR